MNRFGILALVFAFVAGARAVSAQNGSALCAEAERFVRDTVGMVAIVEPDTVDDWRTRRLVPGCRVTAAGSTSRPDSAEARAFFERIRQSGWVRTPDARDAPNEASLRFRRDGADCLFNYYTLRSPLATEAELTVSNAVERRPGERLYNMFVQCTPAAPASGGGRDDPRGRPSAVR